MPQGGIQKGGRKELIVSVDFANVAESIVEEEEEMVTDIASDETLFKIPYTKRNGARKSMETAKMSQQTKTESEKFDDTEGCTTDDSDGEGVDNKTG